MRSLMGEHPAAQDPHERSTGGPEAPLDLGPDALASLQAVAARIAESLGFATVAINLYRPAWDDFQVVVVHGAEEPRRVLMHSTTAAEDWDPMLQERFRCGAAYFIPNGTFDWSEDISPSYVPDLAVSDDAGAWHPEDALFVPLRARDGRLLGVLSVDEPVSGRRPDADGLDVLAAVAEQASLAAEASQHAAAASRHRAALEHLLRVSAQLTGRHDIADILATVCAGVRDGLGFERVTMWLDDGDGHWRPEATAGWTPEDPEVPIIKATDLVRVLGAEHRRHGCVLLDRDVARGLSGARLPFYRSRRNGSGPNGWCDHWLLVPMHDRGGRLVGALWADDPVDHLKPGDETLQALAAFANQAMGALEAARALERERHLAAHDPLTGLRNRRSLPETIEDAVRRGGERGAALLVCDVDTFKRINDVLGYETGDAVLRTIAGVLADGRGASGVAARLGGEEFALVLPGLGEDEGVAAAERLRRAMAERATQVPWGLTVSVGIAVSGPGLPDAESLLRAAGRALVAAKRLGRDRAVVYREQALEAILGTLEERRESAEQLAAMVALAETLDLRDGGTARHSSTVGAYAEAIARELGWSSERVERMRVAGLLHDVGKLGVPDAVLHKPGALSPDEWAEMRRHSELGARILHHAGLRDVASWVLQHHERLDGRGYPAGVGADEIPIEARILSVADAYEAMTAVRPYRQVPLTPEQGRAELERHAGTQFCRDVVAAFSRVLDERRDAWAALPRPVLERRTAARV